MGAAWQRILDWLGVEVHRPLHSSVRAWSGSNLAAVTVDDLLKRQFPWGRANAELPELLYTCLHAQATMRCCTDELALLSVEIVHAWGMAEQRCSALTTFIDASKRGDDNG